MKWSDIRIGTWTTVAAIGLLLGATGVLAERMFERARDEHRRQAPTEPDIAAQPANEFARAAQTVQPTLRDESPATATEVTSIDVRRYIPLVVPGMALLLLVCIVAVWHLAL
jgi:hypothetical protein